MNILIMGPAGSGKGTVSDRILSKYHIPHISTGDMFRDEISRDTDIGQVAQVYMEDGVLVPDEITIYLVKERITQPDCKDGYLLDGFPRSLPQAIALDEMTEEINNGVGIVLNLTIPFEELTKRITGRRTCKNCGAIYHIDNKPSKVSGVCDICGSPLVQRSDDTEERLAVRLNEYEANTKPVLDYYSKKGIVVDIDASKTFEEVWAQVDDVLGNM